MSLTISNNDQTVLSNLAKMGAHLKALKVKMLETEAAAEQAKKEYEYYASSILPMEMFAAGVQEVKLIDVGVLRYEQKYYCKPNKNDTDRHTMAEWLRSKGGEDLVKERASVDAAQIDKLRDAGIHYTEIEDINTQSLKAFLKNNLGQGFTLDEIPACMHFQEVTTAELDF